MISTQGWGNGSSNSTFQRSLSNWSLYGQIFGVPFRGGSRGILGEKGVKQDVGIRASIRRSGSICGA